MKYKIIDKSQSFAYLNESGREIFVRRFEEDLNKTIAYKDRVLQTLQAFSWLGAI
ncbi:MAG: hypothetical protein RXQ72_03540 [Hydrogenobaculum sp.]